MPWLSSYIHVGQPNLLSPKYGWTVDTGPCLCPAIIPTKLWHILCFRVISIRSLYSPPHFIPPFLSLSLSLSKSEMTTTIILNSLLPLPPPQTHSPSGLTRYTTSLPLRYSTTISCNVQTVILPTFKTPQPHKKYSLFYFFIFFPS